MKSSMFCKEESVWGIKQEMDDDRAQEQLEEDVYLDSLDEAEKTESNPVDARDLPQ